MDQSIKSSFLENLAVSFLTTATLSVVLMFIMDVIGAGRDGEVYITIVGIMVFIAMFTYNLCEAHYYIEHPEMRRKSKTRERSYGRYIEHYDNDSSGFDDF